MVLNQEENLLCFCSVVIQLSTSITINVFCWCSCLLCQCVLLGYSCLQVSVCSIAVQLSTGISVFYCSTVVYRYQCVLLGYSCLQVSVCSITVQLWTGISVFCWGTVVYTCVLLQYSCLLCQCVLCWGTVVYRYQCVLLQYSCLQVSVCSVGVPLSTGISVFCWGTLLISEPTLEAGVEAEESEITYCVTSRLLQGVALNKQLRLSVTGFVWHIIYMYIYIFIHEFKTSCTWWRRYWSNHLHILPAVPL